MAFHKLTEFTFSTPPWLLNAQKEDCTQVSLRSLLWGDDCCAEKDAIIEGLIEETKRQQASIEHQNRTILQLQQLHHADVAQRISDAMKIQHQTALILSYMETQQIHQKSIEFGYERIVKAKDDYNIVTQEMVKLCDTIVRLKEELLNAEFKTKRAST